MTWRKLLCRTTAFFLIVINSHWLFWHAKRSVSVTNRLTCQPLSKSFNHTSFYNISTAVVHWETVENEIRNLEPGGHFTPKDCLSKWRVAIIVPYRDRENHLKVFLRNIHPFLQQQHLDYGIFVIEMPPVIAFNRGLLMNIGFKEACMLYDYNCFIFHDVDLLPETTRNVYNCNNDHPKHFSHAIDSRNYTMVFKYNIGGVTALSKDQFNLVNGFSNAYFGWGREDDDLYHRVVNANLTIQRVSRDIGRYKDLRHPHAIPGVNKDELFKTKQLRYSSDGLSNLAYQKIKHEKKPLFTWILIEINDHTIRKQAT